MKRALELAQKAQGHTYPNPLVGSVIVHNGKIIGEGYHKKAGEPHAETNAINSVANQELLRETTIYVTLEPCSHFGKTPPCALKIIEKGFKEVVIGTLDVHEKVNGKGVQLLREAGISVLTSVLEAECQELNRRFFKYHQKKRPYIILKWAQSADGFLDKAFQPYPISNPLVSQLVHQMRAEEHAILVGTQTAINDNPSLTVRKVAGKNPVRILIDSDLKVPSSSHIFNEESPTIVVNSVKEEGFGLLRYRLASRRSLLPSLMEILFKEQIHSVIIEGGRHTLQKFIDESLWDEAVVIKNSELKVESGTSAPDFTFNPKEIKSVGNNIIEFYRNDI